ncbi:ROK family transcriptional regulator [Cryobacterium mannosilyticum]|uniref:ROK family transcriptional regulator n=1 Tax=Cryobacterium mannosilyticum TaxID=1259190 RepID=A0A4V3IDE5_9MICO|nr:ROK family transcriptional regulator [Cryobacterium mannosilyticum]TFC06366.1 ROK family transcriptional regulator [Cryobacterium mannosilyticum]
MTKRSAAAASTAPATVSDVRQRNRARALRRIILSGSTTRAELARESGLSVASVTNLVSELLAEGLVMEGGTIASSGGRPTTLIEPNPSGAYLLGADVGERGVAVELFDLSMKRVDREFRGGHTGEPISAIARDLDEAVAALLERNPAAWDRMVGIGLGLPGIVETDDSGQQVLYAQSLGWPAIPVTELVSHDLPIFAENGAKTQAMAELWDGAARGASEALVVLMGRGVGLAVVTNGQLAHGRYSSAGEWGHVKIERGGRLCRCGGHGCVEAYLGADAILSDWRDAGGTFEGSGWNALGELLEANSSGDPEASAVVTELIATLGSALGGLVNLTNPERVVIGGWVGLRLMDTLAPRIEAAIRREALERPGNQFTLFASKFGGDTVALGAAMLPLNEIVNEPRRASAVS